MVGELNGAIMVVHNFIKQLHDGLFPKKKVCLYIIW